MVVPAADILPATSAALRHEEEKATGGAGFKGQLLLILSQDPLIFPVIVFLPTARGAAIFHDVFANMNLPYPVWEIHSRMSQPKRSSTTEEFRQAERGVLFSSDVTARGIDIKEVTAVMQVGLPSSADQCEIFSLLFSDLWVWWLTRYCRCSSTWSYRSSWCRRPWYPYPRRFRILFLA